MNFKLCKYCKAQIPYKANKCQYCRKAQGISATTAIIVIIACIFAVGIFSPKDNANKEKNNSTNVTINQTSATHQAETETQNETVVETQTNKSTEKATTVDDLTEEQYKNMCRQIYYEDFKNKSVTDGEYVKLKIYTSGSYIKTPFEIMCSSFFIDNSLDGIYHSFCIQSREFPTNYAPEGFMYFTTDYELDSSKYAQGQYFMVYGKFVKDDSYRPSVIPKYIESEKK